MRPSAAAAGALALLVACGDGSAPAPLVRDRDVEALIVQRQRERNPRLRVGAADCPADVAARQGGRFECTLDVEGLAARVEVLLSEVAGDNVSYDIRPLAAVVEVAAVADFLRSRLEPEWQAARVDCGPARARVLDVGGVVECTAFNGTTTRYIQAVVVDRAGTVELRER